MFILATRILLTILQGTGFDKLRGARFSMLLTDMESSDKEESSSSKARRLATLDLDSLSCWRLSAEAYTPGAPFLACLPRERVDFLMESAMGERTFLLACFLVVIGSFPVERLGLVFQKVTLRRIMCAVAPAVLAAEFPNLLFL
jgi:hypothetical protein